MPGDTRLPPHAAPASSPPVEPRADDERAIARYLYLLRTAPPEAIEQVHAEAFRALTDAQRRELLERVGQVLPPYERALATPVNGTPVGLARLVTRAEMRQPGTLARLFGTGVGLGVGLGVGSVLGAGLLGVIAGAVAGIPFAAPFLAGAPVAAGAPTADARNADASSTDASSADASAAGAPAADAPAADPSPVPEAAAADPGGFAPDDVFADAGSDGEGGFDLGFGLDDLLDT